MAKRQNAPLGPFFQIVWFDHPEAGTVDHVGNEVVVRRPRWGRNAYILIDRGKVVNVIAFSPRVRIELWGTRNWVNAEFVSAVDALYAECI